MLKHKENLDFKGKNRNPPFMPVTNRSFSLRNHQHLIIYLIEVFCFILFCLLSKPAEVVLRHVPLFAPEWKRPLAFVLRLPLTYCKTQAGCFPALGDCPSCAVYGQSFQTLFMSGSSYWGQTSLGRCTCTTSFRFRRIKSKEGIFICILQIRQLRLIIQEKVINPGFISRFSRLWNLLSLYSCSI